MMTDSVHTRMNARALRRGLTLVELLLVIVIMGVIMMITAPKLRGISTNTSLRSASQELTMRLALARQTAIRRGAVAVLHLSNDKAWLMIEKNGSQSVSGDTLRFVKKYGVYLSATIDTVRYNPRGVASMGSTQTFTVTKDGATQKVCVTGAGMMLGRGCSL